MHTFCFLCIKIAHLEVICAVCRDIVGLFLCGNMNGSEGRIALLRQLKELIWEKGLPHSVFSLAFHGSATCVISSCNLRQVSVQSASSCTIICVKLQTHLMQVTKRLDRERVLRHLQI